MSAEIIRSDIVVVGAGMVGAAAALGLANLGYQVTVVEARSAPAEFDPAFVDNRVSAVTRASEQLLNKLGVWDAICDMRISPYEQMHVWDSDDNGAIHFDAADLGEPSLGYIIENSVIQLALWQALQSHDKVLLMNPATVVEVCEDATDRRLLTLDDQRQIETQLLIAADGKHSRLRDLLGIETRGWLYDQHALVATVTTAGHQYTAWQRFMPAGPLAFLPLSTDNDKACSIVWSTSPEMAQSLMALPEDDFLQQLQQASQGYLGPISAVESRSVFPLELKHAQTYIKPGFALIGDAAHAIHPLAGQGVNLGFEDVVALLDILQSARQQSRHPGHLHSLRKYERARKGDNLLMLASMDGFKRLFSNRIKALSVLRSSGLNLVNQSGALKNFLVRYAMGLPR